MFGLGDLIIVCGYYGCGKTNLSINLAVDIAASGKKVTLVDLDVVNPYFRSSDYSGVIDSHGIKLISPVFAGTVSDVPSISSAILSVFDSEGVVIFDVGGSDVGAAALGVFYQKLKSVNYDMLYVVNRYRTMGGDPLEAAACSGHRAASRLKAQPL
jgi:signal recognition particle GTPase